MIWKRISILIAGMLFWLVSCQPPSTPNPTPETPPTTYELQAATPTADEETPDSAGMLASRECETYNPSTEDREGQTFFCGALTLPQDPNIPASQQIEIRYALVKSHSDAPLPDPILFLSGGPGSSALHPDGFPELVRRFDSLRQQRDLIFFDQRGVGYSSPPFDCIKNPTPPQGDTKSRLEVRYKNETGFDPNQIPEEYQFEFTCVTDLWNKGIELKQYNSVANAADTMALMGALKHEYGYQDFNLYGISYGTRLALTIIRDFPEHELVRTIVLDSVFPIEKGEYRAQYYIERNQLFESIFELCMQDSACNRAYPDLRVRFGKLIDQLNSSPLSLPDSTNLTGDDLHQSMFPQGPDWPNRIPYFPKMIAEVERGQTDVFMGLRDGSLLPQRSPAINQGVYDLMEEIDRCTRIVDQNERQSYLRRMYNASREQVVELFESICTEAEMSPVRTILESMRTEDVNDFVVRLYDPRQVAVTPQLRKSMDCYEEVPFGEDPQTAEAKMRAAGLPEFLIQEGLGTIQDTPRCRYWPTGSAPEIEDQPIVDRATALILNGQFDSITYPWWAEETQKNITGSTYIMIPSATHSLAGNYGACVDSITSQFLDDPTQALDTSCLSGMQVQFVMP